MKKPTEYQIELFVLNPGRFSHNEKRNILDWIDRDNELQLIFNWYREFYKNLSELSDIEKQSDKKPLNIVLHPVKKGAKKLKNFILAADTPTTADCANNTLKVFVSEEHNTLIRVMNKQDDESICLYAISRFIDPTDIILLNSDIANDLFISSPGGKFLISKEMLPVEQIMNWGNCKLHLPLSKAFIYKDKISGAVTVSIAENNKVLSVAIDGDSISISILAVETGIIPDKLVLFTNKQCTIWDIIDGTVEFSVEKLKSTESRIFIYA